MPSTIILDDGTMDRCIDLMEKARDAMDTQRLITNYDRKSTIGAAQWAGAVIEAMNTVRDKNVYFFNSYLNDLNMVRNEIHREDDRIAENIPEDLG